MSIDRCILGVDPGISGAIAFYFPGVPSRVCAEDVPVAAGEINAAGLADRIRKMRPDVAASSASARCRNRVSLPRSSLARLTALFAACWRHLRSCHRVSPAVWKRHFKLSADKEASRALALRLFPATAEHFSRKKDHGRAEAALIARSGSEVLGLLGEVAA
jgi:crossover junction endodeoxyribonuclease RuvC